MAANRDDAKTRVRASAAYEREIAEKREARWQALLQAHGPSTGRYPDLEEMREAAFALRRDT